MRTQGATEYVGMRPRSACGAGGGWGGGAAALAGGGAAGAGYYFGHDGG